KGVAEYADAAANIRLKWPEAEFRLLGPLGVANQGATTKDELSNWIESGAIQYLGEAGDVRPHISLADCIVLPSYYPEGTPRVLLEAMAMARPVITTDMPGCRAVVEDNVTGYLCEPRDVQSLTCAFEKFLRLEPSVRSAMGEAGRRKAAAEFDQKFVVKS